MKYNNHFISQKIYLMKLDCRKLSKAQNTKAPPPPKTNVVSPFNDTTFLRNGGRG
jgi:hypothetical protein